MAGKQTTPARRSKKAPAKAVAAEPSAEMTLAALRQSKMQELLDAGMQITGAGEDQGYYFTAIDPQDGLEKRFDVSN